MGVIYKLKPEVRNFVLEQKKNNATLSCRKLTSLVLESFKIELSKSSINAIIKEAGLSAPIGRTPKKKRHYIAMPILPVLLEDTSDKEAQNLSLNKQQEEEKQRQEESARKAKEAERLAREAEEKVRLQEERRRLEEAEKLRLAKLEEEKKLQEEAANKLKEDEEIKLRLAKQEAERLAKEAEEKAKLQEERRRLEEVEKSRLAKLEEEKKLQEEAARKAQEEEAKELLRKQEAERLAGETPEKLRAEEENRQKQLKKKIEEAVKRAKEEAEIFGMYDSTKTWEEWIEEVKKKVLLAEEKRLQEEVANKAQAEAANKLKEDEEIKLRLAKQEAERLAREAEKLRLAKLEEEQKLREGESARKAKEEERLAKETEERAKEEDKLQEEALQTAINYNPDKIWEGWNGKPKEGQRPAEEKRLQEEVANKAQAEAANKLKEDGEIKLRLAKQEAERLAREAEQKARPGEDKLQKEAAKKAQEEAVEELPRKQEAERLAKEVEEKVRLQEERRRLEEAEKLRLAKLEEEKRLQEEAAKKAQEEAKATEIIKKVEPADIVKASREFCEIDRTGIILLKAADFLIDGGRRITKAIQARLGREEKDLGGIIESLIYLPLIQERVDKVNLNKLTVFLDELENIKVMNMDISRIMAQALQEVRYAKVVLSDGSNFYFDGQMYSVWSSTHIPYDFASPVHNFTKYINKYFTEGYPCILFNAPGYDIPSQEFFNFLRINETEANSVASVVLYGNNSKELETLRISGSRKYSFVFAIWPWQFNECRKVNKMGEFRRFRQHDQDKDLFIADIEIVLLHPDLGKQVTLNGCAIKTMPNEKTRLVVLSNFASGTKQSEEVASLYLNHWPNIEEAFQDYSRKIELFTYSSNAQRFFSAEHLSLELDRVSSVKELLNNYLIALDAFVRYHLFPYGYEEKDFNFTKEQFYNLGVQLNQTDQTCSASFILPTGYAYGKDLDYVCRRVNEKEVVLANGLRLSLNSA